MKAKQDLTDKLIDSVNPVTEIKIKEKLEIVENEISIICSEKNASIIKEHIAELSNGSDQVCRLNMWRLKQKLCPKTNDPPMAKIDQA